MVSCRPEFSVFVGDLASEVDDFQLLQVFKKFPSCKGAKVVTDQYGYSRYVGSWRLHPALEILCKHSVDSVLSPTAFIYLNVLFANCFLNMNLKVFFLKTVTFLCNVCLDSSAGC